MTTIEKTILENLMLHEEFGRKVLPFIKEEYFSNKIEKILFSTIRDFIIKYTKQRSFAKTNLYIMPLWNLFIL